VVLRLFSGPYCSFNFSTGNAALHFVTITYVRCTFCTKELIVNKKGPERVWLSLVTIAIVRCTVCKLGFPFRAIGTEEKQTDCWSLQKFCGLPSVFWEILLFE